MWFQFSWSRQNVVTDGFSSKIRIYIQTKDIVDKSNVGEHLHNYTLAILHASTEATQAKASASWVMAENERLGGLLQTSLTHLPPSPGREIVSHHRPFSDEGRGFLPDPFRTEKQTVRPLSTVVNEIPGSGVSHNSPCSYLAPFILVCGTRTTGSWHLWLIFLSLSM